MRDYYLSYRGERMEPARTFQIWKEGRRPLLEDWWKRRIKQSEITVQNADGEADILTWAEEERAKLLRRIERKAQDAQIRRWKKQRFAWTEADMQAYLESEEYREEVVKRTRSQHRSNPVDAALLDYPKGGPKSDSMTILQKHFARQCRALCDRFYDRLVSYAQSEFYLALEAQGSRCQEDYDRMQAAMPERCYQCAMRDMEKALSTGVMKGLTLRPRRGSAYIDEKQLESILEAYLKWILTKPGIGWLLTGDMDYNIRNLESWWYAQLLEQEELLWVRELGRSYGLNEDDTLEVFRRIVTDQDDWYTAKCIDRNVLQRIKSERNVAWILEQLGRNRRYRDAIAQYRSVFEQKLRIQGEMLERIPDQFEDLYPAARALQRHFVLHIGPTNSGKTYQSLQAFREAETAVYLAPLRLLAFEVFELTNQQGVPCNLKTGEEIELRAGATHVASTIEMLSYREHYDVAVIDEGQMLEDPERGGRWTAAILGVQADVVHICAALNAREILIQLIKNCGDSYEIHEHERLVPLEPDREKFRFPSSVRDHDALIVFSKKNVLACAADLQRKGIKASVIYGALPYEVRQEEVKRFISGETRVVVATDAIGMGLNLPIERIVFMETQKFDGTTRRWLMSGEVKQIAGRAGRKGIYELGTYTSEYGAKQIRKLYDEEIVPLKTVFIDFPENLLHIEGKLSVLLSQWAEIPNRGIYLKGTIERMVGFCRELEMYSSDKHLIYRFLMIPFNEKSGELKELWKELFLVEAGRREALDIPGMVQNLGGKELDQLELSYQVCDLLYNYCRSFDVEYCLEGITARKKEITREINRILQEQNLAGKKCRECGRKLPWNFPYPMCDSCHHKSYWSFRDDWGYN